MHVEVGDHEMSFTANSPFPSISTGSPLVRVISGPKNGSLPSHARAPPPGLHLSPGGLEVYLTSLGDHWTGQMLNRGWFIIAMAIPTLKGIVIEEIDGNRWNFKNFACFSPSGAGFS